VLACAPPRLALSIRANKSSRLMPLTILGSTVFAWAVMMEFLCWGECRRSRRLLERGERRLNALALVFGDQAGKHLPEMRVLGTGMDVLPSVSPEERGLDCLCLGRVDRTAAFRCEVAGVGFDLELQDAIHRGDQF